MREDEHVPPLAKGVPLVVRNVEGAVSFPLLRLWHARGRLRAGAAKERRGLQVREWSASWRRADFAAPRTLGPGTGTAFRGPRCASGSTGCPG